MDGCVEEVSWLSAFNSQSAGTVISRQEREGEGIGRGMGA